MQKAVSRSISRVLSRVVIYLGEKLPFPSSDHTRGLGGQRHSPPIWSCSWRGLPGQPVARLPVVSYTTFSPLPKPVPFNPSRRTSTFSRLWRLWLRAVCLCGTFPKVTLAGRYPAPCPVEPGLSSSVITACNYLTCLPNLNIAGPVEGVKAIVTLYLFDTGYISLLRQTLLCQPTLPVRTKTPPTVLHRLQAKSQNKV